MDTDQKQAIRKQLRIDFIVSLTVGCVLLAMGIFVIIVYKYFPAFGVEIGLLINFSEKTMSPFLYLNLVNTLAYFVEYGYNLMILIIYGAIPAIFGFSILLRNVFMKLLKSKDDNIIKAYQISTAMCFTDFVFVLLNIVLTIRFFELGIYPKIYIIVNFMLAAAITVITKERLKFKIERLIKSTIEKKKNEKEYFMKISALFKSIVDSDIAPIVICETDHKIVYMNPAAIERYAKRGGAELIGQSLLDCHNEESNEKIKTVIEWFELSADNNRIFTFHNDKEDKDVYMIALRDDDHRLIGYYEKHEYRQRETALPYEVEISV